MDRRVEIYCPKCRWEPRQEDRWVCWPGCRWSWNTFDTGGVCPACGKAFSWTQCLACGQRSPHRDWYHETGGSPAKDRERREEPAGV